MKRRLISGFTLLEVLVALFVLSVTLGGAFSVIIYNLNVAAYGRNSLIAGGLAQEGIEIVRNFRDNDWLASRPFGAALSTGNDWRVDWESGSLLPPDPDAFLRKNALGLYSYTAVNPATIFQRTVNITQKSADEDQVVVKVTWRERLTTPSIMVEAHLFNWY